MSLLSHGECHMEDCPTCRAQEEASKAAFEAEQKDWASLTDAEKEALPRFKPLCEEIRAKVNEVGEGMDFPLTDLP